jgi:hypothetical protein
MKYMYGTLYCLVRGDSPIDPPIRQWYFGCEDNDDKKLKTSEGLISALNELGKEGWKFKSMISDCYLLEKEYQGTI